MQFYPFSAMLARMKYISRWGLMRSSRTESLCEHTADTALLAHTLALISVSIYGTQVRCETVCVAALYHDASEILTGDMPTPVKYKTEPLRRALAGYLTGDVLTEKERQLLKAADRLSALVKCMEEESSGNHEFAGAKAQQTAALHAMQCPEAEYFLEHMLPCYAWTLDELSRE